MIKIFEGDQIVTASEMTKIEKLAFAEGSSADLFMQKAGGEIAKHVLHYIKEKTHSKEVTLLVGKGNNGGDAYTAGIALLQAGIQVSALHLFPLELCSPLCSSQCAAFQKMGGSVTFLKPEEKCTFKKQSILLDGLLGTGFHGKVEGLLMRVITEANQSGLPIIAIDIPSGVDGDTGEVGSIYPNNLENRVLDRVKAPGLTDHKRPHISNIGSVMIGQSRGLSRGPKPDSPGCLGIAIKASLTIYLGMPKLGFFLRQGYDHIGDLVSADFGLPTQYVEHAQSVGHLFCSKDIASLLPSSKRSQNKYTRGYVLAVAGSPGMAGAALMSCHAAMRAGAGIVRLFYPASIADELVAAPLEIIRQPLDGDNLHPIIEETSRAGSLFIGPGMGKTPDVAKLLKKLLGLLQLPLVIDADGIDALSYISPEKFPPCCILTPHRGELKKLLHVKKESEEEILHLARKYADQHKVTIIYKGAPTWVFHPGSLPLVMPVGDPGMATAGSGDVLTGIVAALLAQGVPSAAAAVLGVALHGAAGQIAARKFTSQSIIATDLIDALPLSYKRLKKK